MASVVGHERTLLGGTSAYGGRRCAFPPYGLFLPSRPSHRASLSSYHIGRDFCLPHLSGRLMISKRHPAAT